MSAPAFTGHPALVSSVNRCRQCRVPYWRYLTRAEWGTPGCCSRICHEVYLAIDRVAAKDAGPGIPRAIWELLQSHARIVHQIPEYEWPLCPECMRLDALYAEALAYWSPASVEQRALSQREAAEVERRTLAERAPFVPKVVEIAKRSAGLRGR